MKKLSLALFALLALATCAPACDYGAAFARFAAPSFAPSCGTCAPASYAPAFFAAPAFAPPLYAPPVFAPGCGVGFPRFFRPRSAAFGYAGPAFAPAYGLGVGRGVNLRIGNAFRFRAFGY